MPQRAHTDGHSEYTVDESHDSMARVTSKTKKIGSISMKQHLPQLKLNVPLALTTNQAFEAFVNVSKK